MRLRVNGFSNPQTEGTSPSFLMGKRWRNGQQVSVGYAVYDYTYHLTNTERQTSYLRMESNFRMGRKWHGYVNYEYNLGDDAEGQRVQVGLTYRL